MKKNKPTHEITLIANQDKGHLKVTRDCGYTELTSPTPQPSPWPCQGDPRFGGSLILPQLSTWELPFSPRLPLAMAKGPGWMAERVTTPQGIFPRTSCCDVNGGGRGEQCPSVEVEEL